MFFFFLGIDIILRIVFQLLNIVLNLSIIKNYIDVTHALTVMYPDLKEPKRTNPAGIYLLKVKNRNLLEQSVKYVQS